MPDLPAMPDLSWDRVPLGPFDDRLWWLLIGLCVALLLTVQGIETALEGAWPHHRRTSSLIPCERGVQISWGLVAMLVIPAALLLIGNVAILIWRNPDRPDQLVPGSVLVAIGWVLFLIFSLNVLRLGKLFGNLGLIGPFALVILLALGDVLLLSAFLDIVPDWQVVRESAERGLKDFLPFVE